MRKRVSFYLSAVFFCVCAVPVFASAGYQDTSALAVRMGADTVPRDEDIRSRSLTPPACFRDQAVAKAWAQDPLFPVSKKERSIPAVPARFSSREANKKLKAQIYADVFQALAQDHTLVYVISYGQKENISWLLNAVQQARIVKGDRAPFFVHVYMLNRDLDVLTSAALAMQHFRLEKMAAVRALLHAKKDRQVDFAGYDATLVVSGEFLPVALDRADQSRAFAVLFARRGIRVNGVMHNPGVTGSIACDDYFSLLQRMIIDNGWLQREYRKDSECWFLIERLRREWNGDEWDTVVPVPFIQARDQDSLNTWIADNFAQRYPDRAQVVIKRYKDFEILRQQDAAALLLTIDFDFFAQGTREEVALLARGLADHLLKRKIRIAALACKTTKSIDGTHAIMVTLMNALEDYFSWLRQAPDQEYAVAVRNEMPVASAA